MTENYRTLHDFIVFLGIFIHYRNRESLMYEFLYLYQNFADCVSSQYKYFVEINENNFNVSSHVIAYYEGM